MLAGGGPNPFSTAHLLELVLLVLMQVIMKVLGLLIRLLEVLGLFLMQLVLMQVKVLLLGLLTKVLGLLMKVVLSLLDLMMLGHLLTLLGLGLFLVHLQSWQSRRQGLAAVGRTGLLLRGAEGLDIHVPGLTRLYRLSRVARFRTGDTSI